MQNPVEPAEPMPSANPSFVPRAETAAEDEPQYPRRLSHLPPLPYDTIDVEVEKGEIVRFPINLPYDDGEPMESDWHRIEMNLLIDSIKWHWRGRDFYAGGNMFLHFELEKALKRSFRGPDFFVVKDVPPTPLRKNWTGWLERRPVPDLIVELTSPTTRDKDLGEKFKVYEMLGVKEYVVYDPETHDLFAWRHDGKALKTLAAEANGRVWLEMVDLEIGIWTGIFQAQHADWLRFYAPKGDLILTQGEAEGLRADALAEELARLKAQLGKAD